MNITIRKVSSKKEMKSFIRFGNRLYKGNPYYVPKLHSDDAATFDKTKNGAYEFCEADFFLAYRGKDIVGRVAAIINHRANEAWNLKQVRFGWIDFIEDISVAEALLDTVARWGKEKGMNAIAGPLGFTDFDPEGMLIEGFDLLGTTITIYNHKYYPEFMEKLGFEKEVDWVEYRIKMPEALPERFKKMARIVMEKNKVTIKRLTKSQVNNEQYGQKLFNLINEAYQKLYGYSELTERQIDQYVKQYLGFIDMDMVSFVENEEGELVAAGITIPSLAKPLQKANGELLPTGWLHLLNRLFVNKGDTLELLLVAVKPEYQNKGLNALLFMDIIPNLIKLGFKYAESNPELENNTKVQMLWSAFENEIHKRRRVYAKEISLD